MDQQTLTETKPLSQKERVLSTLRVRPDGVCGVTFLEQRIPRYAARILDLKHDGFHIERIPCPYSLHTHPASVATYKLEPHLDLIAANPELF